MLQPSGINVSIPIRYKCLCFEKSSYYFLEHLLDYVDFLFSIFLIATMKNYAYNQYIGHGREAMNVVSYW